MLDNQTWVRCCDGDLPPDSPHAKNLSFECTFCANAPMACLPEVPELRRQPVTPTHPAASQNFTNIQHRRSASTKTGRAVWVPDRTQLPHEWQQE